MRDAGGFRGEGGMRASSGGDGSAADLAWIVPLLAASLLVRLLFVFVGPFFIRPDEVFQALEPAHRLLTGHGAITWEWHEGIRSWLLPGVIACLMQVSAWAGFGHSIEAVQSVFAVLSLAVVAVAVRFGRVFAGRTGAVLCGALTAFWPDPVLDGAHTLTESQGGNLLAIGTMLAAIALRRGRVTPRMGLGIGLLLGLAAMLRVQLVPGVGVAMIAVLLADPRRGGPGMLLGAALPVAGQAVLDALTLGSPLQSVWKNVAVNLGAHRSELYGTASPVFYLSWMVQLWGAAVLPLGACFVAGFRRAALAGIVAVAVVLSHSLVAHKEWTFIAGAVPLVLVVAGIGGAGLLERLGPGGRQRGVSPLGWAAIGIVAAGLCATFSGYKPVRRDHANVLRLMRQAHAMPGLCGFALDVGDEDWWIWTGGASALDRDVPFYLLRSPHDVAATAPSFDAMLADQAVLGYLPADWRLDRCDRGVCLLHRSGPCAATGAHLMQDEPGLGLPIPPGSLLG